MKQILVAAFFAMLFQSCTKTETVTETIDLERGLIAYYPFNGNANDESGNNKDGLLVNGPTFSSDANNIDNKAANFDGNNDYIRVADQSSYFSRDKLTLSFQFYLRNANVRSAFISKTGWETPSGVVYGIGIAQDNQPQLEFSVADPTDCNTIWLYNSYSYTRSSANLQSNRWYHVALVYNHGLEIMYINGDYVSAKVSNYSSLKRCSSSDLKIGGWWKDDIISVEGKMDEVRIYDRVLAENEIEQLASEIN
jgi:hypothetical protein